MKIQGKAFGKKMFVLGVTMTWAAIVNAQNVTTGLNQAETEIRTWIEPVGNIIIAIGAVVGLAGGIRVYIKWQNGDQDTQKSLIGWVGSCLFLMAVGAVITSFFGGGN